MKFRSAPLIKRFKKGNFNSHNGKQSRTITLSSVDFVGFSIHSVYFRQLEPPNWTGSIAFYLRLWTTGSGASVCYSVYSMSPILLDMKLHVVVNTNKHFFFSQTARLKNQGLFTIILRNRPISVVFYDAHGDTEDLFSY